MVIIILFSSCELELLGLEAEDAAMIGESMEDVTMLRDFGVEMESGRLMIAENEAVFNTKLENVRINASDELYIMKNGEPKVFAELVDEQTIKLTESPYKNVSLGGKLYTVRGNNVFVRSSAFYDISNSNLTGYKYNTGRLVMVVGEENGFFKIPLYPGIVGYVNKELLIPAVAGYQYSKNYISDSASSTLNKINLHPEEYVTNKDFLKKKEYISIIVAVTDKDGNYSTEISNRIGNLLNNKGYRTTASFFSPRFYSDGEFADLFSGNISSFKKYKLKDHADLLLVGMFSMSVRTNTIDQNMKTATLDITLKEINLQNQIIEYSDSPNISGNGLTENEAEQDALNSLIGYLKKSMK